MLYIASDHGGFKLKESLKKFLVKELIKCIDLGPKKLNSQDDYPDYAKLVAKKVASNPMMHQGILLCRSGHGMAIAANKVAGIRAACVDSTIEAKMVRNDDMTNVLCLGADFISPKTAKLIVESWLATPFSAETRHIRRVKKIIQMEK